VGNSTEIKNSIFFNHVEVPHFNYVGDSILGDYAHLGAGVKISNFLLIKDKEKYIEHGEQIPVKTIKIRGPDSNHVDTGLIKLGALIGDYVEIGCNSVLNPGTVLESGLVVPPLSCIGGYFKSGYKFNKTVSYMEELK
jgi:NDP-sugar pyrophosphorylase family protein